MNLLDTLVGDEKKNKDLYSLGPYWNYKNKKTIIEVNKNDWINLEVFQLGLVHHSLITYHTILK